MLLLGHPTARSASSVSPSTHARQTSLFLYERGSSRFILTLQLYQLNRSPSYTKTTLLCSCCSTHRNSSRMRGRYRRYRRCCQEASMQPQRG